MKPILSIRVTAILFVGMYVSGSCAPLNQIPNSSLSSLNPDINTAPSPKITTFSRLETSPPAIQITPGPIVLQTAFPTATQTTIPVTPFPAEYFINDITGHKQYFPLGCEAAAAVDWAFYFGITINEYEFQVKLPQSDNPDIGFVGGLQGPWGQVPPYSYGVHAGPIATLLQEYGIPAIGMRDTTLEFIKQQISKDNPVIAWVIGNMVGGVPSEYVDKEGNKVTVAAYEHVVILTGYDEDSIRYMNNGNFYEVPYQVFLNSWQVLGNMVVIMGN